MIKVDSHEITEKEFDLACADLSNRLHLDHLKKEYVDAVIDQLIDARLMINEAIKNKMEISEEEIDDIYQKIVNNFKTEKQFQHILKKEGDTVRSLREKIKEDLLLKKFMDTQFLSKIKVEEEEVRKYYDENQNTFQQEYEVEASHILFRHEELEKALSVKKEIQNGLNFAEAAKKYSQCPSKDREGKLGYFGKGKMVPEFEKAAFTAPIGVITDPIKTQFGYHLILVTNKSKNRILAFEEVKEGLKSHLKNAKVSYEMSTYTGNLRKTAKIEINPVLLKQKYEKLK